MKIEMTKGNRNHDFSKHELIIKEDKHSAIYELILRYEDNDKFKRLYRCTLSYIYTEFDTLMTMSGDFGFYIFGQSLGFDKGGISKPYFLEKLRYHTTQDLKSHWDYDHYCEDLKELRNQFVENSEDIEEEYYSKILTHFDNMLEFSDQYQFEKYLWEMNSEDREEIFGEIVGAIGQRLNPYVDIIYDAFCEINNRYINLLNKIKEVENE